MVILDRPRHESLIAEVRATGARIKLISDGDLSAAISCAVAGTGIHAVMGIGGVDMLIPPSALTVLLGSLAGLPAHAQSDYPNKPIKVIVTVPAGGGVDDASAWEAVLTKSGAWSKTEPA